MHIYRNFMGGRINTAPPMAPFSYATKLTTDGH